MDHCKPLELLVAKGLKKTPQRIAVLKALSEKESVMTVQQIHQTIFSETSTNLVTVYRMLEQFESEGLIRRVAHQGLDYFELACEHHPLHPHLSCGTCGGFICLDSLGVKGEKMLMSLGRGNKIHSASLVFDGLCASCQKGK